MKYLDGDARKSVGIHTRTLEEAFDILIETFGSPYVIWEQRKRAVTETFCKRNVWGKKGTEERRNAIAQMMDFINEALSLSSNHPKLSNEVFSHSTFQHIFQLLPYNIQNDVIDKTVTSNSIEENVMLVKEILMSHSKMTVQNIELTADSH